MDEKGQTSFAAIIGALAGAAIGGVITYYIIFVMLNTLFIAVNSNYNTTGVDTGTSQFLGEIPVIWNLILILVPLMVAAVIGSVIIKLFE